MATANRTWTIWTSTRNRTLRMWVARPVVVEARLATPLDDELWYADKGYERILCRRIDAPTASAALAKYGAALAERGLTAVSAGTLRLRHADGRRQDAAQARRP